MQIPPLYNTCFVSQAGRLVYRAAVTGGSTTDAQYIAFVQNAPGGFQAYPCGATGFVNPATTKPCKDIPRFLEDPNEFYTTHNQRAQILVAEFRVWLLQHMVHEITL